jgi:hypothetical protein
MKQKVSFSHPPSRDWILCLAEVATGGAVSWYPQSICDEYIPYKYSDSVDLEAAPDRILQEQVLAVPILTRRTPPPEVHILGDMSNRELGIQELIALTDNAPAPTSSSSDCWAEICLSSSYTAYSVC